MATIRAVTVYCASSPGLHPEYVAAAQAAGNLIAAAGWSLIFGGNDAGLMGVVSRTARAAGARVVGITPRLFDDGGNHDHACDELIRVDTMRQRRELLESRGDAFLALAGGIGTYEELFEIIVARYLKVHAKPLVLVNTRNCYEPLMAMLRHGVAEGLVRPVVLDQVIVVPTVAEAVGGLQSLAWR